MAKAATPPEAEVHIVGLRKVGPGRYAVVTGTLSNPVTDNISQPLEYTAEAMKVAMRRLLTVVP